MTDQMFPETSEERVARVRRVFETAVTKASTAVDKAQEKANAAEEALEEFDVAMAAKDAELRLVDERLRRALSVKGIDPDSGEIGGT